MNKTNLYHISDTEKAEIFQATTASRLPAHAVEKDWWVVQTLSMIFELPVAQHLVFKGGTSLSKGWDLIERFSEDIDLAIDRKFFGFDGKLDDKQINKLRRATGKFIDEEFFNDLSDKVKDRGLDKVTMEVEAGVRSDRDRTILLHYPNVIPSPGYLPPRIKIEFSCRSLMEPASERQFNAVVDTIFSTADFAHDPITVPTVNPERTMLEKIFLLHEEFQRPAEKIRKGDRLSRHLYDIVKLSSTKYAETALSGPDLYQTIVAHRREFNAVAGVDYAQHEPKTIQIIPPRNVIDAWRADYVTMTEEMIYEEKPPSFDDLINALQQLLKRINALDWPLK